jgi:hypothetical protein
MVTTAILWVAGIALVAVASSPHRFARLLNAASRPPATEDSTSHGQGPEHPFLRSSRLLTLVVGGVCLVLAVLGTWSHLA